MFPVHALRNKKLRTATPASRSDQSSGLMLRMRNYGIARENRKDGYFIRAPIFLDSRVLSVRSCARWCARAHRGRVRDHVRRRSRPEAAELLTARSGRTAHGPKRPN
jgi:hypothetical protein